MLKATFLYAGYSDYFSGYSCDDDDYHSEHLLYAFYGHCTRLRDIIDELVEDSYSGPASETLPEDCTEDEVRTALLDMLSNDGRIDYDSGAFAECSIAIEVPDDDSGLDDWPDGGESPTFIVVLEYVK